MFSTLVVWYRKLSTFTQPEALGFCFVGQELRWWKKTHYSFVPRLSFSIFLFSYVMACEQFLEDRLIELNFFFVSYVTEVTRDSKILKIKLETKWPMWACGKVDKPGYACTEISQCFTLLKCREKSIFDAALLSGSMQFFLHSLNMIEM